MEFTNKKGEIVGNLIDGVYHTHRKHFFRIFQGYGLSQYILVELKKNDCKIIRITYVGIKEQKILESSLRDWLECKNTFNFEGNDLQTVLPEREMKIISQTNLNNTGGKKMAKIDDFIKQQGMFLKAEMIENDTKAVITGEAEIVHNEKFGTDRLHIAVEIGQESFVFDSSKTNARTIAEALGEDTKLWIGKVIIFEKYKTKLSDGKMVDALNVKEVQK